jgi:hypothetical protein
LTKAIFISRSNGARAQKLGQLVKL